MISGVIFKQTFLHYLYKQSMARIRRLLEAVTLILMMLCITNCQDTNITSSSRLHSRKKRLIYYTSERRLTLPPETLLVLTPTLSLPFIRNLPTGYGASMTISIPFKIAFDDLGVTSEENPWGIWPGLGIFARKKRDNEGPLPGINWAGGDREMMYQVVEDTLHNMGMDGKACLLRAICEMFQMPLANHGFFGEALELFLSPSRSPHSEKRMREYAKAERIGRKTGECFSYHKKCPHSLFSNPAQFEWIAEESQMDHKAEDEPTGTQRNKPLDISSEEFQDVSQQTEKTDTKSIGNIKKEIKKTKE